MADIFAADPIMASAALDRLLHRSTVINIRGESYRLKEKRKGAAAERRSPDERLLIPCRPLRGLARVRLISIPLDRHGGANLNDHKGVKFKRALTH